MVDVADIEGIKAVPVAAVLRVVLLASVVQIGPQAMQCEASSPANASQDSIVEDITF